MTSTDKERFEGDGWVRLAYYVRVRRQELKLSYMGVSKEGGPSHETVRTIEMRGRSNFRDLTLAQLDVALQWKPGTARAIVDGTADEDPKEWVDENTGLRAQPTATRTKTPRGMSPLPLALSSVPDMELAGELVSRLTRSRNPSSNRRLLAELMDLLNRLSADDADEETHAAAS